MLNPWDVENACGFVRLERLHFSGTYTCQIAADKVWSLEDSTKSTASLKTPEFQWISFCGFKLINLRR